MIELNLQRDKHSVAKDIRILNEFGCLFYVGEHGWRKAIIAAIVIGVVAGLISWLLGALGITIGGGLLGAIVTLIVATVVLLIADRFVPGMTVKGFSGAIVAAIAIGVVTWLINWLLGLLRIG